MIKNKENELYDELRQYIVSNNVFSNKSVMLNIEQIQSSLTDSKLNKVSKHSGVCQEALRNIFKYPAKTRHKTLKKLTEYIYKRNNIN